MTYDLLRPRPGRYDLLSVFIPLMMFHFMIVCSIALGVMECLGFSDAFYDS